jgi:intracellular multiplication protein IcmE
MSNTNDFDTPDELGQPLDQDMDFGEFEDKKEESFGTALKSSPLVKFGLIGAGILVVIVLITLFGGDSEKAPNSLVGKGEQDFKVAPGTTEVSPVMKEAMEEKNQQRIEEAQKQGGSAIPTPIDPPTTLLDVPTDQTDEDPLLRWKQMQEERARAQREQQLVAAQNQPQADPQRDAKIQNLATGMSTQMNEILGKDKKAELQHMTVFDMNSANQGASTDGTTQVDYAQNSVNGQTTATANPLKVILPAGKIEYAQMLLEANSDIPGPVVAMIVSGTFNGGRLLGTFTSQEDYLVIKFNTLVTKKGTSIPINAYAVDPQTSLTGVATDVDHRYFQRIVLPAAAKFVEGLGDAYAQTTTTVASTNTSTTSSTEDLNTEQEFGKAISEAAKQVGDVLDEDGKNTKPLVRVHAGTPIGILFMAAVTDQSIVQARTGITGNNQQNQNGNYPQQQGQQYPDNQNNLSAYQQLQMGLQNQQFMQQGGYSGYLPTQLNTVPMDNTGSTESTGQQ